jgi:hypothetical protein
VLAREAGEVTNREPDKCDELAWFDLDGRTPGSVPTLALRTQR